MDDAVRARGTDLAAMVTGGAMLALAACGGAGEPRRQESYAELKARQDREFAASPDIQLPEVRRRLRAMGVADSAMREVRDDYGEAIVLLTPDPASFERLDKRALAKLELDSRYRLRLTDADQIRRYAPFNGAETRARDKATALKELAETGETDRIPRYRPGMDMKTYARTLEAYCGYGPGDALRVVDGRWLEYTHAMASNAAIAASKQQTWAPFACVKRIVDATELYPQFSGNRGRTGAISS